MLTTYSASSRPCADAGWPESDARTTPGRPKTKNAAAKAAQPARRSGFGNTKADNAFSLSAGRGTGCIVLGENASFVWFGATAPARACRWEFSQVFRREL